MEWLVISIGFLCGIGGGLFVYRAGYKQGATKVLNEWKDWLNESDFGG